MLGFTLSVLLSLALVATPVAVAWVSARRLWLSRSRNALFYGLACGFAATGCGAGGGAVFLGAPVDAAAVFFALGSLPLWLAVRRLAAAPQRYGAAQDADPVFSTIRQGAGRSRLRTRPVPSN
jgi:hypothetical protein